MGEKITPSAAYSAMKSEWTKMRDWIEGGQKVIKLKTETYLPSFFPPNKAKYKRYLARAIVYGYTAWTMISLHGSVFRKKPTFLVPDMMEPYVKTDFDGGGVGIVEYSKELMRELLTVGRHGTLVDAPPEVIGADGEARPVEGARSRAVRYPTESIWKVLKAKHNGVVKLAWVLLEESHDISDNPFDDETETVFRVLALDGDGKYYQQEYDEEGEAKGDRIYPRDSNRELLDHIPFHIAGAVTNGGAIDKPPLLDICDVNIGHYVNSADREDNLHSHGRGTVFISSDLSTTDWTKLYGEDGKLVMNGNEGHFIGSNGRAELLQLKPSTALAEAMEDKKNQIIGMGGRFIEGTSSGDRTAEEARIDEAQQSAGLGTLVSNGTQVMEDVLADMALFDGEDPEETAFEYNTDFYSRLVFAADILALEGLQVTGVVSKSIVRHNLRKAGYIPDGMTDEQIDKEVFQNGE